MTLISDNPGLSTPDASSSWGEAKAGYRLIGNEDFEIEKIQQAHREQTIARASTHARVLAIQDTTFLNFDSHEKTKGLGHIGTNGDVDSRGLIAHTQVLTTVAGVPLGILGQKIWSREKREKKSKTGNRSRVRQLSIADKETYKWIEFLEAKWVKQVEPSVVHVGDREVDIFEFIQRVNELHEEFVIRAAWDRKIEDSEACFLWAKLEKQKPLYSTTIEIDKLERQLEVRSCEVEKKVPGGHRFIRKGCKEKVTAIYVVENSAPNGKEPLEWTLFTNIACKSNEEV